MSNLFGTTIRGVCELITIDLTSTGGDEYNFINTMNPLNGSELIPGSSTFEYRGKTYTSYPFQTGGMTRGSEKADVKPQLEFPDTDFYFGAILEANDDGIGAPITRHLVLLEHLEDQLPPVSTDKYVLYSWGGQAGVRLVIELATMVDYNPEGQFPGITMTRQGYPGLGSGLLR